MFLLGGFAAFASGHALAMPAPPGASSPAPWPRPQMRLDPGNLPTLHPRSVPMLEQAVQQLGADMAPWPLVPPGPALRFGQGGERVDLLIHRLRAGAFLSPSEQPKSFDPAVLAAVRRAQIAHGVVDTGNAAAETLKALNVPKEARLKTMEASLRRLRDLTPPAERRYVLANVPAAAVEAVSDGAVARRHIAVVGRDEQPSPELWTFIRSVSLNPHWSVPASIARKLIAEADPARLAERGFRFMLGERIAGPTPANLQRIAAGGGYLRQDPGPGNALGPVRLDFGPRRGAYFMHGTADPKLFARRGARGFSSGCIRVEAVEDLAAFALAETPGDWTAEAIRARDPSSAQRKIQLVKPIPVIWTYLTAFVTEDGQLHFRHDVYERDA